MVDTWRTEQPVLPGMRDQDNVPFLPERLPAARPPAEQHLLFFVLLPPVAMAQQLTLLAERQRRLHGLQQLPMATERLHLTLQPVARFARAIPRLIVQAAIDAAGGIAAASRVVPVCFDRVGSMGVQRPTTLALHCDAASAQAISALRRTLGRALKQRGLASAYKAPPHMSLVYGTNLVSEQAIEPVHWTASRLVLLLSHQGRGHHERVAEWSLRDG